MCFRPVYNFTVPCSILPYRIPDLRLPLRFRVITCRIRTILLSYPLGEAPGPGDAEETQESPAYAHSQDAQQPHCARARVHDECVYRGQAAPCSDPQEVIFVFCSFLPRSGSPRCVVIGVGSSAFCLQQSQVSIT